jgi:hypothetical protein
MVDPPLLHQVGYATFNLIIPEFIVIMVLVTSTFTFVMNRTLFRFLPMLLVLLRQSLSPSFKAINLFFQDSTLRLNDTILPLRMSILEINSGWLSGYL